MVITLAVTTGRPSGGQVVLPVSHIETCAAGVEAEECLLLFDCTGFKNGRIYSSIDLETLNILKL
jgi:hypothetical protein